MAGDDGVVLPIDKRVGGRHVLENAELCVYVVLHFVVVAVEVVGRDVEDDGDVGLEVVHIFKLETRKFDNIDFVGVACHLIGETVAHVSGEAHVDTRFLKNVVGEHRGGGFAVATGYAHHFRLGEVAAEFDFGNHGNSLFDDSLDDGSRRRNARAFHHEVGIENFLLSVLAFLPIEAFGIKLVGIFLRYLPEVGKKNVETFVLTEDCGACAAFTST